MAAVILIVIAVVIVALANRARTRRQQWLRGLGLAGNWECATDSRVLHLDMRGGPASGDYEERLADGGRLIEEGAWEIRGHDIRFTPRGGHAVTCELRAFGDGSIGVHGGDRVQRVYERRTSNVIPLRRRS